MGFLVRQWFLDHSINGVMYAIHHRECRVPHNGGHCEFTAVAIDSAVRFKLPCHVKSNGGVEDTHKTAKNYYKLLESYFAAELRSLYPDIFVDHVVKKFTEILEIANASHRCPEYSTAGGLTTRHTIRFGIDQHQGNHDDDEEPASEYISHEEADVGREEPEEVVFPRVRPASRASVSELLKSSSTAVIEGECGICLEDIVSCSSNAVRMPCSHSFHRVCLVQWLNANHSCPTCRYRIPAAQYKSDIFIHALSI